jgi:hypothetical protein
VDLPGGLFATIGHECIQPIPITKMLQKAGARQL